MTPTIFENPIPAATTGNAGAPSSAPGPEEAYLLLPAALLPFISRFLLRHAVDFRISPLLEGQLRLLYLRQRPTANRLGRETINRSLPGFLLNYLHDLARCRLFLPTGKSAAAGHHIGTYREYGSPVFPIPEAASPEVLRLVPGRPEETLLEYSPPPLFSAPETEIKIRPVHLSQPQLLATDDPRKLLPVPLRLVTRHSPPGSGPAALRLREREIVWLRKLASRLPGSLLGHLSWAGDRQNGFLLLPERTSYGFLPFGEPLRRVKENLFIPLDTAFTPQLTGPQLDEVLHLEPEFLTFLTRSQRFDLAEKSFRRLDRCLLAPPLDRCQIEFSAEPPIDFTVPLDSYKADGGQDPLSRAPRPETGKPAAATRQVLHTPSPADRRDPPGKRSTINARLREEALRLRREGSHLEAAVCFSLAGEPGLSAECWRLAALELENESEPRD
ncbi:MAG: hypothetical protein GXO34_08580 [Deltaproteobacteria bacterium]|nr:hypothetical protein [Deltaproteobacteria bacterium]